MGWGYGTPRPQLGKAAHCLTTNPYLTARTRTAIARLGPDADPDAIAAAARVTRQSALRALAKLNRVQHDQAAATDSLAVTNLRDSALTPLTGM